MPMLFFSQFNKETWQGTLYFCTGIEIPQTSQGSEYQVC